jgi:phage gp29-like protein
LLGHTIKTQILKPLWDLNAWTMPIPDVGFGGESSTDQKVTSAILSALSDGGLQITDESIGIFSKKIGIPVERAPQTESVALTALSATEPNDPFIPSVARRAERKRQARRATEAMLSAASPQLAKILKNDFDKVIEAIETSSSPEEAQERVAILTAESGATESAALIQNVLTSASLNALISTDR